jgi:hypothetical protein
VQQLKVEILLPKLYKNKRLIEGEKFSTTFDEIYKQFGGCTIDNSPLIGRWLNKKTHKHYNDENISYWVICDDKFDSAYFFDELKETLKDRFGQDEILMYSTIIYLF